MKTDSSLSLAMLALVAMLAPLHLAAQSGTVDVSIPFNFSIGPQVYPAGEYRVSTNERVTRLDSINGKAHHFMLGIPVCAEKGEAKTALVFKRYGDRYFLSQIWPGSDRGTELRRSAVEREMSAKNAAPTFVTLVASR